MKKNLWLAAALCCGIFGFSSCSDDNSGNGGTVTVPKHIEEQFYMKYPNAKSVQWTSKDGYSVASFYTSNDSVQNKCSAWFSLADGFWDMTEYEIPYSYLPDSVRTAFESSEYAASPWVTDREVEVLERSGIETLYVISVENRTSSVEMELFYSSDGILLKEVLDDVDGDDHFEDFLPQTPTTSIGQWLDTNFPGARIIDVETENGGTEVELVYKGSVYEVLFSREHNWIYTKQEIPERQYAALPPSVLSALRNLEGFTSLNALDDVDYYKTAASGNFYCIEMETRFDDDWKVYISEEGLVIDKPALGGGDGQNVPVETEIGQWIAEKYAGAVIVGREYDDGLLEVDFLHENLKKTAYFNGAGQWVYSKWDTYYSVLPSAVLKTLQDRYASYSVERDDIEVVENASGLCYEIEMEMRGGDREVKAIIKADGTVISEKFDD